jgi:hypothetical protein
MPDTSPQPARAPDAPAAADATVVPARKVVPQVDSPAPDPTRYGDWEKNGRCIDF